MNLFETIGFFWILLTSVAGTAALSYYVSRFSLISGYRKLRSRLGLLSRRQLLVSV